MNKLSSVLLMVLSGLVLTSCGSAMNAPIATLKDQTEGFHKKIEENSKNSYPSEKYQSLSFGQMKVYKPDAFVRLDSVYAVKQDYIHNNDMRGLHRSGIEDLIPGYRAEALQEIHEVQYEIEHIFQTQSNDSIHIHHAFFLFDYKDSLILVSPFYDFKLEEKYKDLYYAYQFNYHFVTNRDLYISEKEWEFFQFFKNREMQLVGSDELKPFMNHTMHIMETAKRAATVDFRNVSKLLVLNYFKELGKKLTVEKLGELMALERNETVIGYEFAVEWTDETIDATKKSTVFNFSPYLEVVTISTKEL